jgi:hypothetical protein
LSMPRFVPLFPCWFAATPATNCTNESIRPSSGQAFARPRTRLVSRPAACGNPSATVDTDPPCRRLSVNRREAQPFPEVRAYSLAVMSTWAVYSSEWL